MADTDTMASATAATSNEDLIAQKILKRAEIAKMTRQLKDKLSKAGMRVRDRNNSINNSNPVSKDSNTAVDTAGSSNTLSAGITTLSHSRYATQPNSSNISSPMSSPSKSLSEDVTNNITATAISNIQNSKLITPTRTNFNMSMSQVTPGTGSPLKRKNSSVYRSATSTRSRTLYDDDDDEDNVSLTSPLKRHHNGLAYSSSPYNNASTSPFQAKQSILPTPTSATSTSAVSTMQPPKTPPHKQDELFAPFSSQRSNTKRRNSLSKQKENQMPWSEQKNILSTPKALSTSGAADMKEFSTPNGGRFGQPEDMGADLLMFLSNSPARTFNGKDQKDYNRMLAIPTTPKSSSTFHNHLESTPMRNTPGSMFMQQPLLGTPIGLSMNGNMMANQMTPNNRNSKPVGLNKTPFSLSDYINLTPSPRVMRTPNAAAAAESSLHQALFKH